jgi:GntR family transcriptional regulator/MocR family aminotransferase
MVPLFLGDAAVATPNQRGTLLTLPLDSSSPAPLFRQLYDGLRQAILDGTLAAGARVPSTRGLAAELGVSRNTVMNAYEQLLAEGYLEGQVGSGTYVPRTLPDELIVVRGTTRPSLPAGRRERGLSRRGELLVRTSAAVTRSSGPPRPFRPGVPDVGAFPSAIWARLVARHLRRPPRSLLGYDHPAGYGPLRRAIAAHLAAARAVHCEAEQVLVVTGLQHALNLVARVLLDLGESAWVENPGYPGARAVLQGSGVIVAPVPVDSDGIDVATGSARWPDARLAYVSPSHQYPLGVTLSLPRRLALLDWAQRAGAWIVEDDYDSEFRYAGRPLAALQGLDRDGRVIYVSTCSKALFPALRIGYMVVPPDLVEAFTAARAATDRQTATLGQAALADFLEEGHFLRHIRRMRVLYADRQEALLRAARRELGALLEVPPCETGMHLVGWLADDRNDRAAAQAAASGGIDAPALSSYRVEGQGRGGLLLGYAAFEPRQIRDAVRRLGSVLRPL